MKDLPIGKFFLTQSFRVVLSASFQVAVPPLFQLCVEDGRNGDPSSRVGIGVYFGGNEAECISRQRKRKLSIDFRPLLKSYQKGFLLATISKPSPEYWGLANLIFILNSYLVAYDCFRKASNSATVFGTGSPSRRAPSWVIR